MLVHRAGESAQAPVLLVLRDRGRHNPRGHGRDEPVHHEIWEHVLRDLLNGRHDRTVGAVRLDDLCFLLN